MAYHSKYSGAEVDSLLDKIKADDVGSIDSSLSTTSENPVQNKVITEELNKKVNEMDIATINGQPLTNGGNIEVITDAYDDTEIKGKLTELKTEIDNKFAALHIVLPTIPTDAVEHPEDYQELLAQVDSVVRSAGSDASFKMPVLVVDGISGNMDVTFVKSNPAHLYLGIFADDMSTLYHITRTISTPRTYTLQIVEKVFVTENEAISLANDAITDALDEDAQGAIIEAIKAHHDDTKQDKDKMQSVITESSTNYPSSKAVVDYVAEHAGGRDAVLFTPQTLSSEQKTQALLNLSLANAWECIYKDITVEASADYQQLEFELGGVQDVYILFKREYNSNNTGNFKFNVDGMDTNASDITIKLQCSGVLFRIEPSWNALQRNYIGFGPAIYFWSSNNPASANCTLSYRSNDFVSNVSPTKMNNLKITIKNLSNQLKLQIFTRK